MNKDDLKFEIDQLRQDKIIYSTEACATVLVCLLAFNFSNQYFPSGLKNLVNVGTLLVGVGYTIFMGISNFYRWQKIIKLQKQLRKWASQYVCT